MGAKIKVGDTVQVIAGGAKGTAAEPTRGKVLKVLREIDRVLVEGVNLVKRHQSPKRFPQGGIVEKEASLHISNVMVVDSKENKPTRMRIKTDKDGRKLRISARSGTVIEEAKES